MCGRYAASRDKAFLVTEFDAVEGTEQNLAADYNVAPTKDVYVVADRQSTKDSSTARELGVARWGLVPSWAKDPGIGARMINARAETAAHKPSYRRAASRRRCLIPADGYYEWYLPTDPSAPRGKSGKPRKQPYYIHPADGSVMAMAGLYEFWRNPELPEDDPASWLRTMTIITTAATSGLDRIHDRMPLCIPQRGWEAWLDPEQLDGELAITSVIPEEPDWLQAEPVGTEVNNVRNNGPELLRPIPLDS